MANLKTFTTSSDVIDILKQGTIQGNVFILPDLRLDRALYENINKVLIALGAKWNRKAKGHVFDYDISTELKKVIKTGEVTDWKKSTDFFFTPKQAQDFMLAYFDFHDNELNTILEPSAGQGHLLDRLRKEFPSTKLLAIENNPRHVGRLKEKGYDVISDDFINVSPQPMQGVFMNPPFTFECEHIRHAYEFLDVGGAVMVSVASAGIKFRNTKKYIVFRDWLKSIDAEIMDMPDGCFKESGTSVATVLIVIYRW